LRRSLSPNRQTKRCTLLRIGLSQALDSTVWAVPEPGLRKQGLEWDTHLSAALFGLEGLHDILHTPGGEQVLPPHVLPGDGRV
jgi:hypothetical protein